MRVLNELFTQKTLQSGRTIRITTERGRSNSRRVKNILEGSTESRAFPQRLTSLVSEFPQKPWPRPLEPRGASHWLRMIANGKRNIFSLPKQFETKTHQVSEHMRLRGLRNPKQSSHFGAHWSGLRQNRTTFLRIGGWESRAFSGVTWLPKQPLLLPVVWDGECESSQPLHSTQMAPRAPQWEEPPRVSKAPRWPQLWWVPGSWAASYQ